MILAVAGALLYLVSQADWAWWVGLAMVMPFAVMAMRGVRWIAGGTGGDGGAWGPP